jgi:hypothetical protein
VIYKGFTVLTEPPNRRDVMQGEIRRRKERLDAPGGLFTDDETALGPRESLTLVWSAMSRTEAQAMRDFVDACQGRLVPFWCPSWRPDFTLAADYTNPGASLTVVHVAAERLTTGVALDDRRKHLVVIRTNGALVPLSFNTVTDNLDGTETLAIQTPPGEDILQAQPHMLAWLQLMRLETDEPITTWYHGELAEVELPVVTVPRETPAP